MITESQSILVRWKEHFNEILNCESTVQNDILSDIKQLPTREDLDRLPTIDELENAISKCKSGKAPGIDGIPAEVFKYGSQALKEKLLNLIHSCWEQRKLPQDFKDAILIPIFKNKGDRKVCDNYRGISLLSIAGKILAKIIQVRLTELAEDILTESQCGFRATRSTIDMIFSISKSKRKPLNNTRIRI